MSNFTIRITHENGVKESFTLSAKSTDHASVKVDRFFFLKYGNLVHWKKVTIHTEACRKIDFIKFPKLTIGNKKIHGYTLINDNNLTNLIKFNMSID